MSLSLAEDSSTVSRKQNGFQYASGTAETCIEFPAAEDGNNDIPTATSSVRERDTEIPTFSNGKLPWQKGLKKVLYSKWYTVMFVCLLLLDILVVTVELLAMEGVFQRSVYHFTAHVPGTMDDSDCIQLRRMRMVEQEKRFLQKIENEKPGRMIDTHTAVEDTVPATVGGKDTDTILDETECPPVTAQRVKKQENIRMLEQALHTTTFLLLCYLNLDVLMHLFAVGLRGFFSHWGYVSDLIVAPVSLILEIYLPMVGGLLAMLRMWRVLRVAHGLAIVQLEMNEKKTKKERKKYEGEMQSMQKFIDVLTQRNGELLVENDRLKQELESVKQQ